MWKAVVVVVHAAALYRTVVLTVADRMVLVVGTGSKVHSSSDG